MPKQWGRPKAASKWRHAVQMQTISLPTVARKPEKISHKFQCASNWGSSSNSSRRRGKKKQQQQQSTSCLGDGPTSKRERLVSGLSSLVSQLVQPVPSQSGVIYLHSSYKLYCKQTTSFNFNLKNYYLCWRMLPRPLTTQQPSRETARHFARQTKSEQEAGGSPLNIRRGGEWAEEEDWPNQMGA